MTFSLKTFERSVKTQISIRTRVDCLEYSLSSLCVIFVSKLSAGGQRSLESD